ncbi:MAG: exosortase U [Planctomycetota bacterium]
MNQRAAETPIAESRQWWPLSSWLMIAQLPLLLHHCWNLWSFRPHYGFFPTLILVSAWLIRDRWVSHSRQTKPEPSETDLVIASLSSWMFCIAFVLTVFAITIVSPWIGTVAWILTLGVWLLDRQGSNAREMFGPWLMLWMLIPPPFSLDLQLVGLMQSHTSQTVSSLLDLFGVNHLLVGNVFQTTSGSLFVAEACSGIQGQLVLVSAAVMFGIHQRHSFMRVVWLLAAACFWSLVINLIRILLIVTLKSTWGFDLDVGIIHEGFGLVMIGVGLILLYSTDKLYGGLSELRQRIGRDETVDYDPLLQQSDRDTEHRSASRAVVGFVARLLPLRQSFCGPIHALFFRRSAVTGFLVILLIATIQLGSAISGPRMIQGRGGWEAFAANWIPDSVGPWRLVSHERFERQRGSDEGQFSDVFLFASRSLNAQVSVDYPFFGWHDLTECYRARGWTVEKQTVVRLPESNGSDTRQAVVVDMIDPEGHYGLLAYCLFDSAGNSLARSSGEWFSRFHDSTFATLWSESGASRFDKRTVQLQVLTVNDVPFHREQRDSLERLFRAMQDTWSSSPEQVLGASGFGIESEVAR